ncbi:Pfs, NACHT and ankyrin domain protein, partial [Aureobasidium subglaciale]
MTYSKYSVSRNLDVLHKTMEKYDERAEDIQEQKQMSRILKWLAPSDPSTNYNKALQLRHEGTGHWFIYGEAFKQWRQQPNSFLWLYGIPGCGETVLSSTIIENLKQQTTGQTLLYFFFDINDSRKQSLEDAVRSIINQLFQIAPISRRHLVQSWESHGDGSRQPLTATLRQILQDMLCEVADVTIILDALDESNPRAEVLAWLEALAGHETAACRILATSRKEADINEALYGCTIAANRIAIQQEAVNDDIGAYVKHKILNGDELKRWRSLPNLQEEIEAKLMEEADGMFRWVACQIEALADCYTPLKLRKALAELPRTLDETYGAILLGIPESHFDDAIIMLQLLTWSYDPISLGEIVDALATSLQEDSGFDIDNRKAIPQDVLRICGSLVVLVQTDKIEAEWKLQLAHFSVKEYLVSIRVENRFQHHLLEAKAKFSLAKLCLLYLATVDHDLPIK